MIIRAIDFETTGIPSDEDKHAIVEIGWCDVGGLPQSVLCNPGRLIPHEAMAIHHITDSMVQFAIGDLSALGEPDYFVAHHADYERQFFETKIPIICTWKAALRLWPDAPHHGLQFLRYHLALPVRENIPMPHRAGPDAYVCALLMQCILKEGRAPLDDLVRWSNGPALLPRIPLGKHKGTKWDALPRDYLEWIVNKSDLDRDIKANAKHWLGKRT